MAVDLVGWGTLLAGFASVAGFVNTVRLHGKANRMERKTDRVEAKVDQVVIGVTNHEAVINQLATLAQAAEQRGKLADVFIKDYQERHPEHPDPTLPKSFEG